MPKNKIHVLFTNKNASIVKQIVIPRPFLWGTTFLLGWGIILFIYFAFSFGKNQIQRNDIDRLIQENSLLRAKVANFSPRIKELAAKMEEINEFDRNIRIITNLEQSTFDAGAVGGPSSVSQYENEVSHLSYMMIEQIEMAIESLEQRVSYQKQSLEQIESNLKQNQDVWDHTPSIWPTVGWISSSYGMRRHPLTGKMRMHEGIDIAGVEGTPIHATADGKVVVSKSNRGGYGKMIIIDHGYGYKTVFGHNKVNLVRAGDEVKRGQVIAKLGNTGRSTGPHVHYEVRVAGKTVDPLLYIVPHSTSKLLDDLAKR